MRPLRRLDNDPVRVLLRVLIVAALVTALIAVETSSRSGALWRLVTFTYQANVLAAAYYLWSMLRACRSPGGHSRRGRPVCRCGRDHLGICC